VPSAPKRYHRQKFKLLGKLGILPVLFAIHAAILLVVCSICCTIVFEL
jgi:hypothetical protein